MSLLSVQDLHVNYGRVEALHGVSLSVDAGQIVSVIGPNGAGKTTLLSALAGVLPSRGEATYQGQSLRGVSVEERVSRGLVMVPEKRELFGSMTVADNLLLGSYTRATRSGSRPTWTASMPASPACWSAVNNWPEPCRAASSRCWRSAGR